MIPKHIQEAFEKEAHDLYEIRQATKYDTLSDVIAKNKKNEDNRIAFTIGCNFGYSIDRWHKVEDGLPEKRGRYLVLTDSEYEKYKVMNCLYCMIGLDKDGFVPPNGVNVIAWMPLPQPPTK